MSRLILAQSKYGKLGLIKNNGEVYLKDMDVVNYLNYLVKKQKIVEVKIPIDDVYVVEFTNINIVIDYNKFKYNESNKLLLESFFNKIVKHENKLPKNNKVNRNNKHVGNIVVASSLLASFLFTMGIFGNNNILKNNKNISAKEYIYDDVEQIVQVKNNYDYDSDVLNDVIIADNNISTEVIENQTQEVVEDSNVFTFNYEDRSSTDKAVNCKNTYGTLLSNYANMYGVDSNVLTAIATQERGVHSSEIDKGGAVGLMQIQYGIWVGQEISAYNFYTNSIDRFTVTDEMLRNVDTNIRIGSMILQNCYLELHNPIAAIQAYNYGGNCVKNIITQYAKDVYGVDDIDAVFANNDYGWTQDEYITVYNNSGYIYGDNEYLGHIFSYIPEDETTVSFRNIPSYDNNGNIVNGENCIITISNLYNENIKSSIF